MPAEWHPHSSTLLSWPVNRDTWPDERLERVEKVYVNIIAALTRFEHVHLLVEVQVILHLEQVHSLVVVLLIQPQVIALL